MVANHCIYNLIAFVLFHDEHFHETKCQRCAKQMLEEQTKLQGFGWNVCICDDGHDVELLLSVIAMATFKNTTKNNNAPTAIFIRVLPGSGSSSLEKHPNIPACCSIPMKKSQY